MTRHEAKALSIEVWQYLADNGEWFKDNLPKPLYAKIEKLEERCPLCEIFLAHYNFCKGCPIKKADKCCFDCGSAFQIWRNWNKDVYTRQQAAQKILGIITAWEPEETK